LLAGGMILPGAPIVILTTVVPFPRNRLPEAGSILDKQTSAWLTGLAPTAPRRRAPGP
jgi:hypothetical protein